MRVYPLFFFTYTLLQVLFASCYFVLAQHIDLTLVMGTGIYFLGMYRGYIGYRHCRYQQKRKDLLDSLPS